MESRTLREWETKKRKWRFGVVFGAEKKAEIKKQFLYGLWMIGWQVRVWIFAIGFVEKQFLELTGGQSGGEKAGLPGDAGSPENPR